MQPPSIPIRALRFARKSVQDLGVSGILILALFCCMVPFARTYFYLRDIVLGVHPMTKFKESRLHLAFPFLRRSVSRRR